MPRGSALEPLNRPQVAKDPHSHRTREPATGQEACLPGPLGAVGGRCLTEAFANHLGGQILPLVVGETQMARCKGIVHAALAQARADLQRPLTPSQGRTNVGLGEPFIGLQPGSGQVVQDKGDQINRMVSIGELSFELESRVLPWSEQPEGGAVDDRSPIVGLVHDRVGDARRLQPTRPLNSWTRAPSATSGRTGAARPGSSSARIRSSIWSRTAGFWSSHSAAFFLPWPMRSPW